ncbi:MAG TPA: MFS transporter [Dongiaceae bacterium]|nr:MFS transporter [Dongiaceae bacterium]
MNGPAIDPADPAAAPAISRARERWILAATIIASTMTFSDMTIVNVALPVLQRDLGASFAQVQWVVEAYTLVLSALILAGGAGGDLFGRRRVFSIGMAIFAAASAGCGLAPTAGLLVAARAVQGLGAALMMPGSLAIVSASFPRARQGEAIGIWSATTGISMTVAPAFGGWLIDTLSWHAAFLINLPLAAIAFAITRWKVPESRSDRPRRLDLVGMVLATVGLGALTYGLIAAGEHGFAAPLAFGPMLLGAIGLVLFVVQEKHARDPMVPLGFFGIPRFAVIQAFTFTLWAALQGTTFFVPFRLMQVQGFKPTEAGVALLPLVVTASILSRFFGRLTDRIRPRILLVAGALLTGAGFCLLTLPDATTSYAVGFLPALLLIGLGMGVCQVPVTVVALNAAGPANVGTSSAINNMVARAGGLIAIAVFGLILAHGYDATLVPGLQAAGIPEPARQAILLQRAQLAATIVPADLSAAGQDAAAAIIKHAFIAGYRWAMAAAGVMAFAGALMAMRFLRGDRE